MSALKSPVKGRSFPPNYDSFIAELISWGKTAPDEIFAPNSEPGDVVDVLRPLLGPWRGLIHRKAAMLELLRCLAGFESSWNWNEGVDRTNKTSMANIEGQETGIFQVSYDSLRLEHGATTLRDCLARHGVEGNLAFIGHMKSNHALALEYCARLLRISYKWDGPIKRAEINSSLSPAACAEFEGILA